MGFPCDGWTAGRKEERKKEEYLSHTPPKLHQKLIQPYTLSYSARQGWWWWGGREAGYLSFRAQKNGQLSTERSEMTEAGFLVSGFILNCYVSIMGISLQAERKKIKKKKKKPDDRTGRCTKWKTTSSIPLFT